MHKTEKKDAVFNPSAHFGTPEDLFESDDLTKDEKIKALSQWAEDEREAEVADDEGMPDAHPNLLPRILKVLEKLGIEGDAELIAQS